MEYKSITTANELIANGASIIVHKIILSNSFVPGNTTLYEADGTTKICTINLKAGYPGSFFEIGTVWIADKGLVVDPNNNQISIFFSYSGA